MKMPWKRWVGRMRHHKVVSVQPELKQQIDALYEVLSRVIGADKLVLKAGKLNALELMRSRNNAARVLALQRLVLEDPTLETLPKEHEIPALLNEIEEAVAELMARRTPSGYSIIQINPPLPSFTILVSVSCNLCCALSGIRVSLL